MVLAKVISAHAQCCWSRSQAATCRDELDDCRGLRKSAKFTVNSSAKQVCTALAPSSLPLYTSAEEQRLAQGILTVTVEWLLAVQEPNEPIRRELGVALAEDSPTWWR